MFSGSLKIEFTHKLRQENHDENISVQRLMKNRVYVPTKAGQSRRECQRPVVFEKSIEFTYVLRQDNHGENVNVRWLMKNRIYLLPKAEQPRRECQRSVANEKSNLLTS